MSLRYFVELSEQDLSQEELRHYVREQAKNRLQLKVDEQFLKAGNTLPPLVILNETDDSVLRGLRFADICANQLSTIATQTYCPELKTAIRKLNRLPVISTTTLP
jgi:hypothetical protein